MYVRKRWIVGWLGLALLLGAAGCNYPGLPAPTPFRFETPTATNTLVFNPNPGGNATLTAAVGVTNEPPAGATPTGTEPAGTAQPTAAVTTAPPPASPTAGPTRSDSGPGQRAGESLEATFVSAEPRIDGDLSDWRLDRYRVETVIYGRDNWQGVDDLAARVMLAWDDAFLYIGARIEDDRYVQTASRNQLYRGDSLEIMVDRDVAGDFYRQTMDRDDFHIGISPGSPQAGANTEAYLWQPGNLEGELPQVEIGALWVEDAYKIEVAIPWSLLGVEPHNGLHLGFAFSVSDNDRPGEAVQQTMISSAPSRTFNDPTTWGDLVLAGR